MLPDLHRLRLEEDLELLLSDLLLDPPGVPLLEPAEGFSPIRKGHPVPGLVGPAGCLGGFAVTARAFRLGGEVRTTAGGPAGRATAWSGTAGLHGLTRLALAPSLRMTWYRSGQLDGRLYTLRLATGPFGPLQVDLNGGFRSEHDPLAVPADRRFTWAGADLDLGLGRSWFALLSASHEAGPEGSTDQLYTGLTFRF
ncbi:MAG TPA: hypothetical protein VNJ71_09755 [Gemmatimonadales bacterium]|nr:hypothetical protein [Gemmatimonadales bacterium]